MLNSLDRSGADILHSIAALGGYVRRTGAGFEVLYAEPPVSEAEREFAIREARNALRPSFSRIKHLIADADLQRMNWDVARKWSTTL